MVLFSGVSAAILVADFAWGQQPIIFDAADYLELAQLLLGSGIGGFASHPYGNERTNGYPALLGVLITALGRWYTPERLHIAAIFVQWLALVLAGLYGAARLGQLFGSSRARIVTYGLVVLNVALLMQATELLTDSLSATLIFFVLLVSLSPGPGSRQRVALHAGAAFAGAAFAAMLRPANVSVLLGTLAIWGLRAWWFRDIDRRSILVAAVCAALPFVPQIVLNARAFGVFSPLIASNLYEDQLHFGVMYLKYATVASQQTPRLLYVNPFAPSGARSLIELLQSSPTGFISTLFIHFFGLVDQDYGFTVIRDLHPWYCWPLSIGGYVLLGLAAAGSVLGLVPIVATLEAPERSHVCSGIGGPARGCLRRSVPADGGREPIRTARVSSGSTGHCPARQRRPVAGTSANRCCCVGRSGPSVPRRVHLPVGVASGSGGDRPPSLKVV